MKLDVLIAAVSHGASHFRAARALEAALHKLRPGVAIQVIDFLDYCPWWFRAYYSSYQILLRYYPSVWAWLETKQHAQGSIGPNRLYSKATKGLESLVLSRRPAVIVATEVGACELFAIVKRNGNIDFRLVGAVTGLDADRSWSQPEVDLYAVAPGKGMKDLQAAGVAPEMILECGQPIDMAFSSLPDKTEARARLQVQPGLPLVLVLFGGAGWGDPRFIAAEMTKVTKPFQAAFIVGKNQSLESEVKTVLDGTANRKVLGWVDNIHEWMAAADILISKPGGSTLMEALTTGTPILAIDPLPGNERRACDWIEEQSTGHWIKNRGDLAAVLECLLGEPSELRRLSRSARSFARPQAACELAAAILNLQEVSQQP